MHLFVRFGFYFHDHDREAGPNPLLLKSHLISPQYRQA
jgi:hypothetical protein